MPVLNLFFVGHSFQKENATKLRYTGIDGKHINALICTVRMEYYLSRMLTLVSNIVMLNFYKLCV